MIPDNITKEHVLKAMQEIDANGIQDQKNHSKKYDLVFNRKKYPPKFTISIANKFANGQYLDSSLFVATQARRYLRNLSPDFILQLKNEEDPVAQLIEKYKTYIRNNGLSGETYKWRLLQQFKGRPDTDAADFHEEIKDIDYSNLMYQYGKAVIRHIAKEKPEQYRACYKVLFDEDKPLIERVKYFNESTLKLYREINPDEKISHHHDERTIATLLTYHNPDKYTFYKDSFYQKYCQLTGITPDRKNEKYAHYLELIDDLVEEYISDDEELINLVNEQMTDDCFADKNHRILAQDILFQTLDGPAGMGRNYWRIGTGDDANDYWEYMKTNGKVCVGWSKIVDLTTLEVNSRKDLQNLMAKEGYYNHYPKHIVSKQAGEFYSFYNDIKNGDIVLAQKGKKVLGIGIIRGDYYYEPTVGYAHQRDIEWVNSEPGLSNNIGLNTTVFRIKDMETIKKVDQIINNVPKKNLPLNQILFGPPGTGKTYHTINKAIAIANPGFDLSQPRDLIKKEFDRLMVEGQIVFTTFHQSMSYEDFVEGIKPQKQDIENANLTYEIEDGIFKRICKTAQETKDIKTFDAEYDKFIQFINEQQEFVLKTPSFGNPFGVRINSAGSCIAIPQTKTGAQMVITRKMISEYIFERKIRDWKPYIVPITNYFKEHFFKAEPGSGFQDNRAKNYVLIIDEINRGNVAQILGELITLIEEDKRQGKEEALEVVLPYSKEAFSVPPNLYIIGTMNTADRSVEAIDTALRRRFSFEEMSPRYDLKEMQYDIAGINAADLLQTLNKRIGKLLDKDHQIGHSYFIKKFSENAEEKLLESFYWHLIPLLQEYFFGDFGKIGLVLGEGFVKKREWNKDSDSFAQFDYESPDELNDREVFEIVDYRNSTRIHSIKIKEKSIDMDFTKAIKLLMKQSIE